MSGFLHLEAFSSEEGGKTRRLTRLREDGRAQPIEIFHEMDRAAPGQEDAPLDGHVLPVLLYAMMRAKPLKLRGALSRAMARNLEEIQNAWRCWRPERYRKIDILPERVVDARRVAEEDKAIAAFSGGADATFTLLRHARILPETARYTLPAALMVHGFDVALSGGGAFEKLTRRVRPLLDELQVNLRTIRTNSKELGLQDWEDSHALQLAGCLHMFAGEFRHGLIGSTDRYDALVFPWGSNVVTDHLMSGGGFSVVHDGAGFSRTEKIAEIARWPAACRTLKVCWEGEDQSGNCGTCEKCVRTRLNFLAAGCGTPPCFPGEFSPRAIGVIAIRTPEQLLELRNIVRHAKTHGVTGDWLPALEKRIDAWKPGRPGRFRAAAAAMLDALGLKKPLRKMLRS